jgi:multiple sugar transport system substrate-binding protein
MKPIIEQAPELEGKWATAVLPKKENNLSIIGGSDWSVFQYSKQKDAAMKFVAFMSKPEQQVEWMKLANAMPAAQVAWEDEFFKSNANMNVFGEQLKNAQPLPVVNKWEEVGKDYLSSFEQIYTGGADVQKTMDEFQKKAEQTLGK